MRVLYLHGFASSPKSSKASFFATKFAARGIAVESPDLNEPDFSTLTVTRMLGQVSDCIDSGTDPVVLVGSSLGGFVAVHAAQQHPTRITHYGYGRVMPVHYELYEDARRYDAWNAQLLQPTQVFQGRRDTAVDPVAVEEWCRSRPNVELHMVEDDHQLLESREFIWTQVRRFLELPESPELPKLP